jgi:hypothetical protein
MYMRGSNNQPDMVQEKIGNLQAEIAELKTEVKHINRQAESRDRWLQAIGSALFVLTVSWIGQNLLESYSAHKTNPVGVSTSKAK